MRHGQPTLPKQREEATQWLEIAPDGIDLSTLITVSTPNRMWTVWGGSRSKLRQLAANYKITRAAIEEACEKGQEFTDFFGSTGDPRPDNPITGIYAFKKKFSGLYTEFPDEFYHCVPIMRYTCSGAHFPLLRSSFAVRCGADVHNPTLRRHTPIGGDFTDYTNKLTQSAAFRRLSPMQREAIMQSGRTLIDEDELQAYIKALEQTQQ